MMCRQYVLNRATSGITSRTTVTSITTKQIFETGKTIGVNSDDGNNRDDVQTIFLGQETQLGSIGTTETAGDDVQTICLKQGHIRNHIRNHSDINN